MRLVATVGRHTKLDGVGMRDLFHLGELALTFDPANVKNVVLPVGSGCGSNLVKSGDAAIAARRLRRRRGAPEPLMSNAFAVRARSR